MDDAVLDEALGRGARRPRERRSPARGHPARPRPVAAVAHAQPRARTRVVRTRAELRDALADAPRPLGLVPTMGWLHDGHRSLMRRARDESATTVVTIFVNPRQFNEAADYTRYPRNEARDLAICEAEGVDLVFAPGVDEVYPPGFDTIVSVGAVARAARGRGAARPLRRRRDRRRRSCSTSSARTARTSARRTPSR